jgi:prepilin-type N-terminal cleavage/methylation domain-containing protein
MKTSQTARARRRGFTLTELMIVISIMGTLLAVSSPALSRFVSNWRLNGATAQMAMAMRAARSTAVNKNINVIFVFDQSDGEYYFVEDTDGDGSADAGERQTGVQTLPAGVAIGDYSIPQQWITFTPRGNTADAGTIVVRGRGERELLIRVFGGTGNISVERNGDV